MTRAPNAFSRFTFSRLCLSGIVKMHRYPRSAATSASPKPVFPLVGSTIVPPGLRRPFFSAASIIAMPMRSFTDPPGFRNSAFARINGWCPFETAFNRMRGVRPIASRMSRRYSTTLPRRARYNTRRPRFEAGLLASESRDGSEAGIPGWSPRAMLLSILGTAVLKTRWRTNLTRLPGGGEETTQPGDRLCAGRTEGPSMHVHAREWLSAFLMLTIVLQFAHSARADPSVVNEGGGFERATWDFGTPSDYDVNGV